MSTHTPSPGRPVPGTDLAAPTTVAPTVSAPSAPSNQAARGAAGTVIGGRYLLVSPVGSGGMGAVWRANDQLLHREVAIKEVVLPPNMPAAERNALTERTMREARAAAGLSHPAVIRVFDVVTDSGRPWIVMELLKADSLATVIERDGPLAHRAVAKIGLALLGALEAAHQAGVLHRDVKPGNVLIGGDGRCVLTDFGVARSARDSDLTTPGMVLGSPHFISPERAIGGQFGPPSDLFSLGVTLYTAVEGRPPFDRGDAIRTMQAVVSDPPEPPRRAGPLTPVLHGLLEKDPARRWDVERTRGALRGLLLGPAATPAQASGMTTRLPVTELPPRPGAAQPTSVISRGRPAAGATSLMPPGSPATPEAAATAAGHPGVPAGTPPGGGQDPWRVGRATVSNPGPVQSVGAVSMGTAPMTPPVAPGTPYQPIGYPAPRRRPFTAWLFGVAAVLVAMVLVVTAVGYGSGWFSEGTPPGDDPQAKPTTGPDFEVQTYQGQGVTVQVPAGWKRVDVNHYVQFHDPTDHTSWLRVNVTWDNRDATRILRVSHRNFVRGCCGLTNYQRVALQPANLDGHQGAELEYTATRAATRQRRHGIWRMIVVGGRNYQVYMSVPQDRFPEHAKVFAEAVRSLRLTG